MGKSYTNETHLLLCIIMAEDAPTRSLHNNQNQTHTCFRFSGFAFGLFKIARILSHQLINSNCSLFRSWNIRIAVDMKKHLRVVNFIVESHLLSRSGIYCPWVNTIFHLRNPFVNFLIVFYCRHVFLVFLLM